MTADLGHHYIAGAWRSDAPHGSHPVENPSDRSVIGTAPDGSAELASEAVMAARTAFATTDWASNPRQRAAALLEFADILESRADVIQVVSFELLLARPSPAAYQKRNVGPSTSAGVGPSGLDQGLPLEQRP